MDRCNCCGRATMTRNTANTIPKMPKDMCSLRLLLTIRLDWTTKAMIQAVIAILKKYEGNDLLRDWSSGVGSSVKIKLLKSHCYDDEQQASGKKIKYAFDPLLGDGRSVGNY